MGRSRGGLTTKIHAIVDALGNPLAVSLTGGQVHSSGKSTSRASPLLGQVHDITQAQALVAQVEPQAPPADKGYDADAFVECLEARAITPAVPPKSNRKVKRGCDPALYGERNLIERFFNVIKHFRGIATRNDKTAKNVLAGIHPVCALAWLK